MGRACPADTWHEAANVPLTPSGSHALGHAWAHAKSVHAKLGIMGCHGGVMECQPTASRFFGDPRGGSSPEPAAQLSVHRTHNRTRQPHKTHNRTRSPTEISPTPHNSTGEVTLGPRSCTVHACQAWPAWLWPCSWAMHGPCLGHTWHARATHGPWPCLPSMGQQASVSWGCSAPCAWYRERG
jgi:hypothetical protein